MPTECPIRGQVRYECASLPSCHQTCSAAGSPICPLVCVVNGCECPPGTVVDFARRECVPAIECEGMHNNKSIYI